LKRLWQSLFLWPDHEPSNPNRGFYMNIGRYKQRLIELEASLSSRMARDVKSGREQLIDTAADAGDASVADEAFGHLDEVTAAELRETFLALARECGSTAILITHQLEEAIGVGDRIVVLGRSARLLADIHVAKWEKSEYGVLREAIQSTLQSNQRDGRLDRR